MGSVIGKTWQGKIHIYGKSRAQRTDIASYLSSPRTIQNISVYDYTSGSPVFIENADIDIAETTQRVIPQDDDDFEGSWRNREVVTLSIITINN
jgi:hypothetical protein